VLDAIPDFNGFHWAISGTSVPAVSQRRFITKGKRVKEYLKALNDLPKATKLMMFAGFAVAAAGIVYVLYIALANGSATSSGRSERKFYGVVVAFAVLVVAAVASNVKDRFKQRKD